MEVAYRFHSECVRTNIWTAKQLNRAGLSRVSEWFIDVPGPALASCYRGR